MLAWLLTKNLRGCAKVLTIVTCDVYDPNGGHIRPGGGEIFSNNGTCWPLLDFDFFRKFDQSKIELWKRWR